MYKFLWISLVLFLGIAFKFLGMNFSIFELLLTGTAIVIMVMLDDIIRILKGK